MPKIYNTKKQRAEELLKRLQQGPSFVGYKNSELTQKEVERRVKIWLDSWITPEVIRLIPQLKDHEYIINDLL